MRTSTPKRSRSDVGDLLAGEGLLAREQALAALDQGHLGAERGPGLGELAADRAAAEHDHALRAPASAVVASRLFQARTVSRPSIGGIAAPLPVATTTARRAVSTSSPTHDPALAVEAALAAEELDPAFFEPGQLAGVVEVVDHLVAAVEDRLRVELAGHRLGDAGDPPRLGRARRPGAAAPSRACRRSRSIRRRPGARSTIATLRPPSARRPAQTSPAGAGAEHDRVVARVSLTGTSIPDTVQSQAQT